MPKPFHCKWPSWQVEHEASFQNHFYIVALQFCFQQSWFKWSYLNLTIKYLLDLLIRLYITQYLVPRRYYWNGSFINHKGCTYCFGNNGRQVQASKSAFLVSQAMPNTFIVSMHSLGSDFISSGKLILKWKKKIA